QLDDELLEREAVGRLAALLLELDELLVDLAEILVLALGSRLLRDDAREVGADRLERRREVEARRARRDLRDLAPGRGRGRAEDVVVERRRRRRERRRHRRSSGPDRSDARGGDRRGQRRWASREIGERRKVGRGRRAHRRRARRRRRQRGPIAAERGGGHL